MSDSPIEKLLAAVDRLDVDAVMALYAPDARVLFADGRRAEGTDAVRELVTDLLAQLRSTTHRITARWHVDDAWIVEVETDYVLQDWMELKGLERAFVARAGPAGITDLRIYGAHEQPLADHPTGEEGMLIGARWVPPL